MNFFAVYFIVGFALFEVINHRWVGLDARPTKPAALTPAHLATTLVLGLTISIPEDASLVLGLTIKYLSGY